MKRWLLAGFVGGAVAFVWTTFSWTVLPWHDTYMREFRDPEAVARVLRENAPVRGVYTLGEREAVADSLPVPAVYAAVAPRPAPMTAGTIALQALATLVGAHLIGWVLCAMSSASYWKLVAASTSIGLSVAVLTVLPNVIWWRFPASYLVIGIVEPLVGWFLAGLAMARYCVNESD